MEFMKRLSETGIKIVRNNGGITIGSKTYTNKCFLLSVAEGIFRIHSDKYKDRNILLGELIKHAEEAGIDQKEKIDTEKHIELFSKLEAVFNVQIHIRWCFNGEPGNYCADSNQYNNLINVLCISDSPENKMNATFAYVDWEADLCEFQ